MTAWEYTSVTIAVDAADDPLPALGLEGWEAYGAMPMEWEGYAAFTVTTISVLLKRPVAP